MVRIGRNDFPLSGPIRRILAHPFLNSGDTRP